MVGNTCIRFDFPIPKRLLLKFTEENRRGRSCAGSGHKVPGRKVCCYRRFEMDVVLMLKAFALVAASGSVRAQVC